jgi:hypothetical protein
MLHGKHPIPRAKMAGMGGMLLHDYRGVDVKTVRKVAQDPLTEVRALMNEPHECVSGRGGSSGSESRFISLSADGAAFLLRRGL